MKLHGRHAAYSGIVGSAAGDDSARRHRATFADNHAGQNDGAGANPGIVADGDRCKRFALAKIRPLGRVPEVVGCVDHHARSHQHACPDRDLCKAAQVAAQSDGRVVVDRQVVRRTNVSPGKHVDVSTAGCGQPPQQSDPNTATERLASAAGQELRKMKKQRQKPFVHDDRSLKESRDDEASSEQRHRPCGPQPK